MFRAQGVQHLGRSPSYPPPEVSRDLSAGDWLDPGVVVFLRMLLQLKRARVSLHFNFARAIVVSLLIEANQQGASQTPRSQTSHTFNSSHYVSCSLSCAIRCLHSFRPTRLGVGWLMKDWDPEKEKTWTETQRQRERGRACRQS